MAQTAESFNRDPSKYLEPAGTEEIGYGLYEPSRRVLGSMARAAAAGEFLRRAETVINDAARPDPPKGNAQDHWSEDEIVKIAA